MVVPQPTVWHYTANNSTGVHFPNLNAIAISVQTNQAKSNSDHPKSAQKRFFVCSFQLWWGLLGEARDARDDPRGIDRLFVLLRVVDRQLGNASVLPQTDDQLGHPNSNDALIKIE